MKKALFSEPSNRGELAGDFTWTGEGQIKGGGAKMCGDYPNMGTGSDKKRTGAAPTPKSLGPRRKG
jgi:hypothetical protein